MGRHRNIKQDKEIAVAYHANPNILGVARELKVDPKTVRRALLFQGVPLGTNDSLAVSLVAKLEKDPKMAQANFNKLASILGSANVIGVMRNPEKFKNTVVDQARMGLLLGVSYLVSEDKLLQASPSAIAQCLPLLAELASGKYQLGAGRQESFNSEEILISIKAAIRKVKTFNPVLAKETEEALAHIDAIDTTAFKIKEDK